jgi:hypothetical protein
MNEGGVVPDDVQIDADVILAENEYNLSATSPSTAVIESIASVEGLDPFSWSTTNGTTLYDFVDPEALDRLLANGSDNNVSITFAVGNYTVWIDRNKIVIAN